MRIVIQIEEPKCKGSQWGAWLVCLKKSNEGKCGWSDMSDEKRIRDDIIEVTSVWDIGHFKGSGFYPDGDRKLVDSFAEERHDPTPRFNQVTLDC